MRRQLITTFLPHKWN